MGTARRLLLLRHAKSSWDHPELADHDRPLAPRGRRAAAAVGAHLGDLPELPDVVLCSTAVRTVQTLEGIRPALPVTTSVELDDALYGADDDELLEVVRRLPAAASCAMVIAHNPGIGDLAVLLTGHGDDSARAAMASKFPTAALARLAFQQPWSAAGPGGATLEEFWTPR
jgi:phosphohistidine phosphatase